MIGEILALVLYLVIFAAMAYRLIAARKEAKYWKKSYDHLVYIIEQDMEKEGVSD